MEVIQEELKIGEKNQSMNIRDEKNRETSDNLDESPNNLDEFYYALEEALEERSTVYEKLEGLEHFNLKKETNDPYLQGLYLKHGMFDPINLKSAFQIFNYIEDEMISYEPWKTMKTPIKAFVCNQLSLFYLGYQGVAVRDLECSDIYFQEAIYQGNRMTIANQAEELLNDINVNDIENSTNQEKLTKAINLFERAIAAGHKNSIISLIECYKLSKQYNELFHHYGYLINALGHENYIKPCIRDFKSIDLQSESLTEQFVFILLNSKPSKYLHNYMLDMIHFVTEDILDKIVMKCGSDEKNRSMDMQDEKNRKLSYNLDEKNIINNLLFIFNCDSLLYEKYIGKLFKHFNICNQIKECLKN